VKIDDLGSKCSFTRVHGLCGFLSCLLLVDMDAQAILVQGS